tara:strand:+ start:2913 stop:3764 length:852 start_codon:yes stop_codon:yes gene_type:complete
MATNVYFNNFAYGREQDLVEDLTIEAIKIYGHNVKYLPRTKVNVDLLFGEDTLSKFDEAIDVEMYIKNVEGFEGEGDLLSRFGLEIRDQITFTVARKRFDQAITSPKLMSQVGYNLIFENGSTKTPSRQYLTGSKDTDSFMLEGDDYLNTINRPQEGDLIYFPMVDKIFEIKFVEHEQIFYQTGRLQTYDVRCELFEYSSEQLDTGDANIDGIEDIYSLNTLDYQFTLEDGTGTTLLEDGGTLLQEYRIEDTDASANNEFFQAQADNILDFSEVNPFGEIDRY